MLNNRYNDYLTEIKKINGLVIEKPDTEWDDKWLHDVVKAIDPSNNLDRHYGIFYNKEYEETIGDETYTVRRVHCYIRVNNTFDRIFADLRIEIRRSWEYEFSVYKKTLSISGTLFDIEKENTRTINIYGNTEDNEYASFEAAYEQERYLIDIMRYVLKHPEIDGKTIK